MTSMAVDLAPLRWWHLPDVERLERDIFAEDAWSDEMFWSELAQGQLRHYLIAHVHPAGGVAGYGGVAGSGGGRQCATGRTHSNQEIDRRGGPVL